MKNFLYREDYAPVCPVFSNYYTASGNQQHYLKVFQKAQLQRFEMLHSVLRFVFFLCHWQILYRNKIKSPE